MKWIAHWLQAAPVPVLKSIVAKASYLIRHFPTRTRWTAAVVVLLLMFFVVGQLVTPSQEHRAESAVKAAVIECAGTPMLLFSNVRFRKRGSHELEFMGIVKRANAENVNTKQTFIAFVDISNGWVQVTEVDLGGLSFKNSNGEFARVGK